MGQRQPQIFYYEADSLGSANSNRLMKLPKKRIFVVILGAFIGMSGTLLATDWQTHAKKTWEFKAQKGVVKITLLVDTSTPKASSLGIAYDDEAHPSLPEEVGFVRDVLHQLPTLGVDPASVHSICMRGFAEPEVAQRIAIAALHSTAWGSYPTVTGGAERVVEDLPNATRAYNALNAALEEYSLVATVQGVEKVASAKCLGLKLSDPAWRVGQPSGLIFRVPDPLVFKGPCFRPFFI